MNKKLILSAGAAALICACSGPKTQPAIPQDKAVEAKVEQVLKGMTLEDKAGQLVQLTSGTIMTDGKLDTAKLNTMVRDFRIGSFLNALNDAAAPREEIAEFITAIQEASIREIGIPTIYGLDEIHGSTYVSAGTLFPQEVNLGATFNREHAKNMGSVIAYETRAAMVPWTFAPVMDLGRNPVWPRIWESWGEDSYLQAQMSVAETVALQGEDPNHVDLEHVSVSLKHYLAYGAPVSGQDRTPAVVAYNDLRDKYFRPFKESIQAGALNIMINSASINGVPVHASREYLTGWLKDDLNWDGMAITDWADINNLFTREHVAADLKEAVALGINAGVDMIMDPYNPFVQKVIVEAVNEGLIPMARLDDAVRRILRLKVRLGLFENPTWDITKYDKFGGPEFKEQALRAAVESEVLLKNEDNVLPIRKGSRILVTGPNANSMRTLNGGWSYTWQGVRADSFCGGDNNTILEAMQQKFGEANVRYVAGVEYDENNWQVDHATGIRQAVAAAAGVDVIVACIGENSYCETPGNINDLNLSANQKELVRALSTTGKPIVLILNEGRPRLIGDIEPLAKAVVDIMLPGNSGGDALALLLSGEENFSGKLPFTYSRHINALHAYDYKVSEHVATMAGLYNYDATIDVQWIFGSGLSYTTFEYSDFKRVGGNEEFVSGDMLDFEVTVKNTGNMAGKEAVLLYSSDLVASIVPDVRRLREFTKISLEPGESKVVRLSIPADELSFIGQDNLWVLEKGDFRFSCGNQSLTLKCAETKKLVDKI